MDLKEAIKLEAELLDDLRISREKKDNLLAAATATQVSTALSRIVERLEGVEYRFDFKTDKIKRKKPKDETKP